MGKRLNIPIPLHQFPKNDWAFNLVLGDEARKQRYEFDPNYIIKVYGADKAKQEEHPGER